MRKRHLIIIGILVFLIGIIGGAYLVLRSAVTRGELANSTPASQGKSSDELLDELLKLNQSEEEKAAANANEYIPPEEKNLTEDFTKELFSKTDILNVTPEAISSDDFYISTILPYLKSNEMDPFPEIPDSSLKIVAATKINAQQYFKNTQKPVNTLAQTIYALLKDDLQNPESEDSQNHAREKSTIIGGAFEEISRVAVPKNLVQLQKNILIMAYSSQKVAEALADGETDPLKSVMVLNNLEAVGDFWKQTLTSYQSESKKY